MTNSAQGITMFDAEANDQFPAGAKAYAAYVDGSGGDQPNYSYIVREFPGADHLSITLFGADADCLDIEPDASTPDEAAAWYRRQKARGIARPCLYADAYMMDADILPVITAAAFPRAEIRLWSAHYTGQPHICGPASCGATSVDMDGTQWTDEAMGRDLDESLLLPDFFGSPKPAPDNWTEKLMKTLPTVRQGDTGANVRTVQGLCCARGHAAAIDGAFGPGTESAVKAVQSAARVAADGVVGPVTWGVLVTASA